jgi:hypothetical protein
MMSGVHMTEQFHMLFICACLRLSSLQEHAQVPSGLAMAALTEFPGVHAPLLLFCVLFLVPEILFSLKCSYDNPLAILAAVIVSAHYEQPAGRCNVKDG